MFFLIFLTEFSVHEAENARIFLINVVIFDVIFINFFRCALFDLLLLKILFNLRLVGHLLEEADFYDNLSTSSSSFWMLRRGEKAARFSSFAFRHSFQVFLDWTRVKLASSFNSCGATMMESWVINPVLFLVFFMWVNFDDK